MNNPLAQLQSVHVLHTHIHQQQQRWGEIGAEKREKKKREALRYKRQRGRRKAIGQTWGFVFSIAGGGAEHVLISHNATQYVISHYALCQRFTSFHSFQASLSPPVAFIPRAE